MIRASWRPYAQIATAEFTMGKTDPATTLRSLSGSARSKTIVRARQPGNCCAQDSGTAAATTRTRRLEGGPCMTHFKLSHTAGALLVDLPTVPHECAGMSALVLGRLPPSRKRRGPALVARLISFWRGSLSPEPAARGSRHLSRPARRRHVHQASAPEGEKKFFARRCSPRNDFSRFFPVRKNEARRSGPKSLFSLVGGTGIEPVAPAV
jgi:hypothetical protein